MSRIAPVCRAVYATNLRAPPRGPFHVDPIFLFDLPIDSTSRFVFAPKPEVPLRRCSASALSSESANQNINILSAPRVNRVAFFRHGSATLTVDGS